MSRRVPYSVDFHPPCPVLAVRVAAPSGRAGIGMVAVVDTGADVTLVPAAAARLLGLPVVSAIRVVGVTGAVQQADVHAAEIDVAGRTMLVEAVAFGDEAIVGRDVLNQFLIHLDGPRQTLELGAARVGRPRRRRKT